MYTNIYNLKQVCKSLAADIKNQKEIARKFYKNGETRNGNDTRWTIFGMKRNYRHYHIAYCMLRGKSYEIIEQPKDDQKKLTDYDWKIIEQIRSKYAIEETVHISA